MPIKDRKFADKILQHLDKLDNASLQRYLLRLINDKGFLESIFNTIREGIIVIDGNLNIQFVNSACKPMLGISQEDIGKESPPSSACCPGSSCSTSPPNSPPPPGGKSRYSIRSIVF